MKLLNIFNNFREIYLFCRNEKGEQEIKTLNSFFPYFYVPDNTGTFRSYKGQSLRKIIVSAPHEVSKNRSIDAYEADILFPKRYLIDKVLTIEQTVIKYAFIDIEVLADELPNIEEATQPISCISVYNSLSKSIHTFYLGDYDTEFSLIEAFIHYMQQEKFDIWFSWNVKFDYNYLYNRVPDFAEKISPIKKTRYGDETTLYPAGISIIDYLGWFQKVTLNRERSYALNDIAQKYLDEPSAGKFKFGTLSTEIRDKNINDIKRMVKIEEKFKLIPYYDEVRRLAKVEWEDLTWNSRIVDMLLLQEAYKQKVVLPMKPHDVEKEEFEGAYRECYAPGAHFDIGKYDLTSAYPYAIIDFCLDPANIIETEVTNTTDIITIDDTLFKQNASALLPTVVKQLITLKNDIKQRLSTMTPNTEEHKDTKTKYNAIKSVVNCFSEDTNILTIEGIKNIKDIKIGDKVYNVNPKTLNVEIDEIIDTQIYDYQDDLYNYKNDIIDLHITKEHKFLIQNQRTKKLDFKTVSELYTKTGKYFTIPKINPYQQLDNELICLLETVQKYKGKIWARPKDTYIRRNHIPSPFDVKHTRRNGFFTWYICEANQITSEQLIQYYKLGWKIFGEISPKTKLTPIIFDKKIFVQFLGWFISEGSSYQSIPKQYTTTKRGRYNLIQISQHNITNQKNIIDLITRLGFTINCQNSHQISFCSEILYYYLQNNCGKGSYNKKIPNFLFTSSYDTRNLFLKTLYKGDGNKRDVRYNTVSWQLIQDLLRLLVINGNNSIRYYRDSDIYRIVWHNKNKSINNKMLTKQKYNGKVYCCTTKKNHTIFAGRNGNFSLTGQSAYGVMGSQYFRLYSKKVASATTFLVRDLLHYIKDKCEKVGHKIIYVDTDSVFIDSKENLTEYLNNLVNIWAQSRYGKNKINIEFEYEGQYEKLLILAKCRYVGYLRTSKGIEEEIKGVEAKRKDSTVFTKRFQKELINKILNKEEKTEIFIWIKDQIELLKTMPFQDISFPCKLARQPEVYKNVPIFVRALKNTPGFNKKVGDPFYYIFMEGKDESKKELVMAFDEETFDHIDKTKINWNIIIKRNVIMKLDSIFEAMKWNVTDVIELPKKKTKKVKEQVTGQVKKRRTKKNEEKETSESKTVLE